MRRTFTLDGGDQAVTVPAVLKQIALFLCRLYGSQSLSLSALHHQKARHHRIAWDAIHHTACRSRLNHVFYGEPCSDRRVDNRGQGAVVCAHLSAQACDVLGVPIDLLKVAVNFSARAAIGSSYPRGIRCFKT